MAVAKKNTRKSTPKSQSQSASTSAAPKTTRTKKPATVATSATSDTSETKAVTVKSSATKRTRTTKTTPSETSTVKKAAKKAPVPVVKTEENATTHPAPETSKEILENQTILSEIIESVVAEEKAEPYLSEDKAIEIEISEQVEFVAQNDEKVSANEPLSVELIAEPNEVEKAKIPDTTEEKVGEVAQVSLNTEEQPQVEGNVLSDEEAITDAVSADIPPVKIDVVDTDEDSKADEIAPMQISEEFTDEITEEITDEITEEIATKITEEISEELLETSTVDETSPFNKDVTEESTSEVSGNIITVSTPKEEPFVEAISAEELSAELTETDITATPSCNESAAEADDIATTVEDKPTCAVSTEKVTPEESHTEKVNSMFSSIKRYDFLNHFLSMGLDYLWRREMISALTLSEDPRVLDMAAGTLDVSLSLLRKNPKVQVVAGDICQDMLSFGEKKIRYDEKSRIDCQVMDAKEIPFEENSFEAVTIAFGIRNVDDRVKALREMRRVLVNGGQLCVLEFAPMTTPYLGKAYHWYLDNVTPQIAGLFGEEKAPYEYLAKTIKEFLSPTEFCQELREAGFNLVRHKSLTLGVAHLYFAIKN